tara:strand:- start:93 stop:341 length:249 start_codon:yes stop_codon:yes gene_type:complete
MVGILSESVRRTKRFRTDRLKGKESRLPEDDGWTAVCNQHPQLAWCGKIFELTVWPYLPLGFTQTVIGFGVSELGAYLEFEA